MVNRFQQAQHNGLKQAPALGLLEDDVPVTPACRATIHEKIARGMRALRAGNGVDGETFFAQMAAEFDEVEQQGFK